MVMRAKMRNLSNNFCQHLGRTLGVGMAVSAIASAGYAGNGQLPAWWNPLPSAPLMYPAATGPIDPLKMQAIPDENIIDVSPADAEDMPRKQLLALDYSHFKKHELAKVLKFQDPHQEDYPFYHAINSPHKVRIINDGIVDLEMRLRAIGRARTKIDYMTYVFKPDLAGRMVIRALLNSAINNRVRVRLLLDWYNDVGTPGIDESLATALKQAVDSKVTCRDEAGQSVSCLEIKYYNKGKLLSAQISKITHRNHVKLVIIDDREVLGGGRNTAEEYFMLNQTQLNYMDRDYLAFSDPTKARESNLALTADAAFNQFWIDTTWTSTLIPITDAAKIAASQKILSDNLNRDEQVRNEVEQKTAEMIGSDPTDQSGTEAIPTFVVPKLTFVIDRPGHADRMRRVTPALHWRLVKVDGPGTVLIENYAFPISKTKRDILAYLPENRGVPVTVLTNGYPTTDNARMTEMAQASERSLIRHYPPNWAFDLSGHALPTQIKLDGWQYPSFFATHAKTTQIISPKGSTTMIGSYNFDERSELLNNESIVIFDEAPIGKGKLNLAEYTAKSIHERIGIAHRLLAGPQDQVIYNDGTKVVVPTVPFKGVLEFFGLASKVREEE